MLGWVKGPGNAQVRGVREQGRRGWGGDGGAIIIASKVKFEGKMTDSIWIDEWAVGYLGDTKPWT